MTEIKGYTEEEINYIIDNYANKTNKEIASYLGKTVNSIGYVATKLKLIKQPHKAWTKEEELFLRQNYLVLTSAEIAERLGRTIPSINARCDELGLIKHDGWDESEIQYLRDNYMTMDYKSIGAHLGRTDGAVCAKCFDLGLYKKEVPWTNEELNFLKDNYFNMTNNEIGEILNRSPSAIRLKGSRMGFKKYPYYCNYHYFDVIDTEEKAYWLGFLSADGWINKNDKSNAGVVGIELQYNDIKHLQKFNKCIQGNYRITDRWRTCTLSPYPDKLNHMCVIRIFSVVMYNALESLGFTNNKSFDIEIPELRNDLYRHYLRGFYDGDGCLSVSNNRLSVSFCTASEALKNDIIELVRIHNIDIKDYSCIYKNGTVMYRPEVTKNSEKLKLLDYMYKDASIYLDRKYKKYLKAKKKYDASDGLAS